MAVAALVLGIVGLVFCLFPWWGIISGVLAAIFGIVTLIKQKNQEEKKGKGMAIAGLVTGIIAVIISVIVTIGAISALKYLEGASNELLNGVDKQIDIKSSYAIGETFEVDGYKVTVSEVKDYVSDDEYTQPKSGYKYIKAKIDVENTGKESKYVSSYDFSCYADNTAVSEAYVSEDDEFSGSTVSTGNKALGYMYYEVPENANSIKLEYEYDIFDNIKAVFVLK